MRKVFLGALSLAGILVTLSDPILASDSKIFTLKSKDRFREFTVLGNVENTSETQRTIDEYFSEFDRLFSRTPSVRVNGEQKYQELAIIRKKLRVLGLSQAEIQYLDSQLEAMSSHGRGILDRQKKTWTGFFRVLLSQSQMPGIEPGLAVSVRSQASSAHAAQGFVSSIERELDPVSGASVVRVILVKSELLFAPGTTARILFHVPLGGLLTVPLSFVKKTQPHQGEVLLMSYGGVFERKAIELGDEIGEEVVVVSGLRPGDKISDRTEGQNP